MGPTASSRWHHGVHRKITTDAGKKPAHEQLYFAAKDDTDAKVEVVLRWTDSTEENIRSYVNGIRTHAGGTHENGLKAGVVKAVRNYMEVHSFKPRGVTIDPWPLRLMQILISIIYVRTVWWKLRGKMCWNGTAAWYPVWVDTYLRHRPPRWMLRPFFIRIATWGTLLEELALGILIWIYELRPYVMLTGIVMHLVFEAVMNLQLFGWTMIAGLRSFSDPAMVERFFFWLVIHS